MLAFADLWKEVAACLQEGSLIPVCASDRLSSELAPYAKTVPISCVKLLRMILCGVLSMVKRECSRAHLSSPKSLSRRDRLTDGVNEPPESRDVRSPGSSVKVQAPCKHFHRHARYAVCYANVLQTAEVTTTEAAIARTTKAASSSNHKSKNDSHGHRARRLQVVESSAARSGARALHCARRPVPGARRRGAGRIR